MNKTAMTPTDYGFLKKFVGADRQIPALVFDEVYEGFVDLATRQLVKIKTVNHTGADGGWIDWHLTTDGQIGLKYWRGRFGDDRIEPNYPFEAYEALNRYEFPYETNRYEPDPHKKTEVDRDLQWLHQSVGALYVESNPETMKREYRLTQLGEVLIRSWDNFFGVDDP